MTNLISAELKRLFKSKVFHILCLVSLCFGAFLPITSYVTRNESNGVTYADSGIFAIIFFGGFVSAILISLFTGTEYSDGTIRNKLICGHTRASVYFSKLIVNFFGMVLIFFSFYVSFLGLSIPLLKVFRFSAETILFGMLTGCVNYFAWTALFTGLTLCKSNKAVISVLCMVLSLVLIIVGYYVEGRIKEPETYPSSLVMTIDGVLEEEPEEPNPNYLTGTKREVYQFFYDFLPSAQAFQASGFNSAPQHKGIFMVYSLIFGLASTFIALPVFKKKNIN